MAKVADGDVRALLVELKEMLDRGQAPRRTDVERQVIFSLASYKVEAALERLAEQSDAIRREKNAERE